VLLFQANMSPTGLCSQEGEVQKTTCAIGGVHHGNTPCKWNNVRCRAWTLAASACQSRRVKKLMSIYGQAW
jgi:hypothetical protein